MCSSSVFVITFGPKPAIGDSLERFELGDGVREVYRGDTGNEPKGFHDPIDTTELGDTIALLGGVLDEPKLALEFELDPDGVRA
jgi:hypothetical protein